MLRIMSYSVSLIFVCVMLAGYSTGQAAVGTPAFGSFGGGPFDTVNLGNLNVNFKIPVRHKAGRGMPFAYDLSYDSSVWNPVSVNGQMTWQPVDTGPYWGWQGLSATVSLGNLTYSMTETSGHCGQYGQNNYTQWEFTNFVYTDENGNHNFNYTDYYIQADNVQNCPPTGPQPPTTPAIPAADGSGYTLYATPGEGSMSAYETSRTGTTFNSIGIPGSTDANGNEITLNGGTYTDTLGQTALTVAGTPPSNTTLSYTAPSGANAAYTVSYKSHTVQTAFNCNGINEYNVSGIYLVDKITLPDGSYYQFGYEATPGAPSNVTARVASVTLPTGGSITYQYSGGSQGIVCADGSTAGLTRTLNPGGAWTYTRNQVSGAHWQTTMASPPDPQNAGSASDDTVIDFQKDTGATYSFYETQRKIYQGTTTGTLLQTTVSCYNGNTSNCPTTGVSSPISQRSVSLQYPNGGLQSQTVIAYSGGLPTLVNQYSFGSGAPGGLLQSTAITYANLGTIQADPASIITTDASGDVLSETTYTYDEYTTYPLQSTSGTPNHTSVSGSRGNATTIVSYTNSSGGLTQHFSYFDTGNVSQAYDVSGAITTYNYANATATCGNSFPTSVSLPVNSLSTSTIWNCIGGVATQSNDLNNQPTSATFTDPFYWRPALSTDPESNITNFNYTPTTSEFAMKFNSNASVAEQLVTVDGLGRPVVKQRQQSVGSGNYDSTQTTYDVFGRAYQVTMPYVGTAGQTTTSAPTTATTYDALSRPTQTKDGGGGYVSYTYSQNDVLQSKGPAPSGENNKSKQLQYDALGRLTSVCEVTQGTGYVPCAQSVSYNGYMTTYVYDFSGVYNRVTVTQNAQSSPTQTRVFLYDLLGRLVSETNPETSNSATLYTFDSASGCTGSYSGDLVKRVDARGNATCYTYDGLHRVTSATYTGPYSTPTKNFIYDAATVNGVAMANAKGHLAEAYTGTSASKITDLGFVYSVRGEVTEVWESTLHSSGYYHVTSAYWANGKISSLWMSGLPTISYGADSEGRMSTVSASSGQNPVTGVTYTMSGTAQPIGSLTQVTYGSGDHDNFSYDTNTGRMTQFKYTVSTKSEVGNLGWNPNGSLGSLGITDPFNTPYTQNCTYTHDDLARIDKASCGSTWGQSYSFDPFGNIDKSVLSGSTGNSFQPTYTHGTTNTNQYFSLPGFTPTYDANGNLLTDSFHTYTWDAEGKMISLDSTVLTYDALGRMVEQSQSGTYFQIVYSPKGKKLAIMKAQVIQQAFVPLPGKTKAEYLSWGLSHYRHPDWLGSSRLESSTTHAIIQSAAYDAFGVPYVELSGGNGEISYTGQNKDTAWLQYDFIDRQYDPNQGRWLSPDPAGLAAVDPASPQSWNRYAYVQNNPLALVDPFGDDGCYDQNGQSVGVVQGICESMGGWTWQQTMSLPSPVNGRTYTAENTPGGMAWAAPNGEILSSDSISELGLPTLPPAPIGPISCDGFGSPCTVSIPGSPYYGGQGSGASVGPTLSTSQKAQKVTAKCMTGRLIDNFIGPSGSGTVTVAVNVLALMKPVATSYLPGPGWVYTAAAVGYDTKMVVQSYYECKYGGGQPTETPAGEQPEEPEQ